MSTICWERETKDALLADLQSTTAHLSQPQQSQPVTVINSRASSSSQDSRGSTPPLPPPPSHEVLDSLPSRSNEPIYEAQNFHVNKGGINHQQQQREPEMSGELSSNLSELDQLLQDLNSAQFMNEVDKKNAVNSPVVNGMNRGPPNVAPKPVRANERATVESLLNELDSSVPHQSPHSGGVRGDNYSQITTTHTHQAYQGDGPVRPYQGASTATKELDDLMSSLSEFKITHQPQPQNVQSEPAYAKPQKSRNHSSTSPTSPTSRSPQGPLSPQGPRSPVQQNNQLETMLGDLQSDMNRQGASVKTKGVCAACNKSVVGQVITALGKIWHIEHFTCAHCNEELGTMNFYERDGLAYCETDYHNLFAPRCGYCNGPIVDKCVTALNSTWHPEHFFCAQCGQPLGDEGFHEKDGKAFCRDDYYSLFAPKCGGCGRPIMDNYISALNRHWHPECFVCWDCHAPFGGGSFFDHEGLPYCETHYHAKKGSLCATCQKPITGRCITAMFKKFHPEHFVCAFCLKQLNKGTFKDQNEKPYCHPCFVKLFG
ncbi:leupaxin isoform X1 [Patella vulgata]|uniref:leupaxin isoform X1 n=2 Tax=Patella vulgata TaxID=6465 RepID=UPI00217FB122|nr:leupaxin isoform X1 [Patella vulgata]